MQFISKNTKYMKAQLGQILNLIFQIHEIQTLEVETKLKKR